MERTLVLAFYITISCVPFVISKIIIAVLSYKRCKRRPMVYDDGLSDGKMVMFRSTVFQSLTSEAFMKKTLKLNDKDIRSSGGHGTMYKLAISDTLAFAVKRLNRGSSDRDRSFERELEAMGDTKHRNIVTRHGYCTAPRYNRFIYEVMPDGSLVALLHGMTFALHKARFWSHLQCNHPMKKVSIADRLINKIILDWQMQYNVALWAARGISYLHHDCIPHIIHRDIKPSNILLDQNINARVSDFGLATLMPPDKTHVSTFVAGTFGYLAPEYFDTGRATAKGNVYGYGVVLLELLTGKKPTDKAFLEEGTKLVTWVKSVVNEKREEYVLDRTLEKCPIDEINYVFVIALMCLESERCKRPTMGEVVKFLEQIRPGKL